MPTLNWIGKDAVVNHHHQVPFHLLKDVPELSCGDPGSGNLIVQGDNLVALKALLPYYAGQVKCIYIDPPYNTGNEGWAYNDNVNSPVIREWLGKVVGKEGETLDRHDRWLCMMYPRLALLRRFLAVDGVIFISIDDNEVHALRFLMDEIFGANNFVTSIAWHKRVSPANDAKHFSTDIDWLIVYARDSSKWRPNRLPLNEKQRGNYRNPDNDARGSWNSAAYTCAKTADERPNLFYAIHQPNTGEKVWPSRTRVWAYDPSAHKEHVEKGLIYWGIDGQSKKPRLKKFLSDAKLVVPRTFWAPTDAGNNQEGKLELLSLQIETHFANPKPTRLISKIIEIGSNPGDLVLDSFAGTGTTGHAILNLNFTNNVYDSRRFILVEMEHTIARDITAERVRRVSSGYSKENQQEIKGLGGSFRYCELGEPLFDESGKIRSTVRFADLARHVYFTETGEPLPRERVTKSPFIGECRGVGIYLLYNGILLDKSTNGGNVLTRAVLASLPKFDGPKVIYCAGCLLSRERLQRENIVVRQTPYEIKVS